MIADALQDKIMIKILVLNMLIRIQTELAIKLLMH